ncbi:MAG TPA: Calx-beta domain-containing protein, partial [Aquabacterium sp.]|nr:Calx-beta domain-containing protein [Aquabacterium sp.]
MPILTKSSSGTVTGLWGSAFIRLPSGKLKALAVGDKLKQGDQVVTTEDGIVQITPPKGKAVEIKPNLTKPVQGKTAVASSDLDKTIESVERGDEDAATAAGLNGGANGGLLPGLRVDRVVESVGSVEFQYETARGGVFSPIAGAIRPLFFTIPPKPVAVDTRPSISVSDASGQEGSEAVFTITLSKPSAQDVHLLVRTVGVTASNEDDLGGVDGFPLVIPAGQTFITVGVPLFLDGIKEAPETFRLEIISVLPAVNGNGDPVGPPPAVVLDGSGTGTIEDVELTRVTGVSAPIATEGEPLVFVITMSGASTVDLPLSLALTNGTGAVGVDTGLPVQISFDGGQTFVTVAVGTDGSIETTVPAGASSVQVRVPTVSDGASEGSETIGLSATGVDNLVSVDGIGTIVDAVVLPKISVSDATGSEGQEAVFTISLDKPSAQDVHLLVRTVGLTASNEDDLGGVDGFPLVIPAGQTSITVGVPLFLDGIEENPYETFQLEVIEVLPVVDGAGNPIAPPNATVADGIGAGTITDKELPQLSIEGPVAANEATGTVTYTVKLSNPSATGATVYYSTQDAGATAGSDYTQASGSLTFA